MSVLRITKLLRSFRTRYRNKHQKFLYKEIPSHLFEGKLKDAQIKADRLVKERDIIVNEFIKDFIEDEHINIMLIDKGNTRWYMKGLLHTISAYFIINIIYFIIKHLFN